MADTEEDRRDGDNNSDRDDDDEERRVREEAMERLLMEQEEQDHHDDDQEGEALLPPVVQPDPHDDVVVPPPARHKVPYTQCSFTAAVGVMLYALRTRQQWYLALVYLTSSKWAYIVFGNAIVASCVSTFFFLVKLFLKGLRPAEAEGLGDFFRWNVTETCLALTMFRSEITVRSGIMFLILVLAKCLHWVAETRRGHFSMTEEAVLAVPAGIWKGWPSVQSQFFGIVSFLEFLLLLDVAAVAHCAHDIAQNGPSVAIFFGFEAAILFVSAMSNLLLAGLHFCDGMIHWAHERESGTESAWHRLAHSVLHHWKDHKATLTFAVEVQAQAAKFLFYIIFFAIVLTYYGMPINLFREVYMSFQNLRQRLLAFAKYRRLMQSMSRFESLQSEEELEEAGRVCIICRDAMTLGDCKKLPGCGHVFHKSCLREWLIHQQTCPTCRGDIAATEARVRAAEARQLEQERQQQREQEQETQQEEEQAGPSGPAAAQASITPSAPQEEGGAVQEIQRSTVTIPPAQQDKIIPPDTTNNPFPCLYRVDCTGGAAVWIEVDGTWTAIRSIPFETIVLCTSLEWIRSEDWSGMMLRIPDGYVREGELERISVQLPIPPQRNTAVGASTS